MQRTACCQWLGFELPGSQTQAKPIHIERLPIHMRKVHPVGDSQNLLTSYIECHCSRDVFTNVTVCQPFFIRVSAIKPRHTCQDRDRYLDLSQPKVAFWSKPDWSTLAYTMAMVFSFPGLSAEACTTCPSLKKVLGRAWQRDVHSDHNWLPNLC